MNSSEIDSRGSGRNRSEIIDLDHRLKGLDEDLSGGGFLEVRPNQEWTPLFTRSFLLTVECYAAVLFQRLRAELFESRLGMPKNDAEVFSILERHGKMDLIEARKLRQFCEARALSSRDLEKLNHAELGEMVSDLSWIREILVRMAHDIS
ncbi:MAG: hypothetical protein H7301_07695 [Cryobacterium sp.]|nr:hypothetical protein [Oligoflexia bacterium]